MLLRPPQAGEIIAAASRGPPPRLRSGRARTAGWRLCWPAGARSRAIALIEITKGLYRWTAPHPAWDRDAPAGSAGDWDRDVGSVLYDLGDTIAVFDPLLPAGAEREVLLRKLDRVIAGRPVSVLTTSRWHRRDREALAERYPRSDGLEWNTLPRGVSSIPLRGVGEIVFWLPAPATLVPGDSLLGTEEGLRLPPESWLADVRVDRRGLARQLQPLLELPIGRILVSHGTPVLHDGRAQLAHALTEAEG